MFFLLDAVATLENIDRSIFLFFNQLHTVFLDHFMSSYSGKWVWLPMYVAIAYVLFRNFKPRVACLCLLGLAITIVLSDQISSGLLKPLVERLRPSNLDNPLSGSVHIVDGYRGGRYSFPSSHASNTFGLAVFMLLLFRKRWLSLFLIIWAVLTCYSRIYLGVHYPGDLFVGMLIGMGAASLLYCIFRKVARKQEISPNGVRYVYLPVLVGALTVLGIAAYAFVLSFWMI